MDSLDILTNAEHIIPYFQAVYSADEQTVIGYEILGRIKVDQKVESMGPFFLDDSVPEEYKIEMDDLVLKKALEKVLENQENVLLFVNRDADLLMIDQGESFLSLLKEFQGKGLKLNRVVLEMTEHTFKGDFTRLQHMLTYLRTYGIKLSIENAGQESSNLDRIGKLSPEILKIGLQPLITTSPDQAYHNVLHSISLLARKIGATILYEDIEVDFQLQYAWKTGGRYFQGFYLSRPNPEFLEQNVLKEKLAAEFHHFIQREKRKIETFQRAAADFSQRIQSLMAKNKKLSGQYDNLIKELAEDLSDCSFRIYICNEDGFQQTGNIFKLENGWVTQPEYYMKNWSWRPYFLENIIRMRTNKKGYFSDLYRDIETGETIRTFSFPIDEHLYLFIDLPYTYLYEQEGML
ncbi:EAL-associated domain-containing protein [Metabacillus sp. RGM 3146]|uniref:EAL-associated domain-containing protein n=1 Tax=Metabacillus sp. RGM 3146 TaxID=3401092 RepID=UPI003B9C5136